MKRPIAKTVLPPVEAAAARIGQNIRQARDARDWTMQEAAERALISLATYKRLEAGDPSVSSGILLQVLFHMGLLGPLTDATAPGRDALGEAVRNSRRRQRVKAVKEERYDF